MKRLLIVVLIFALAFGASGRIPVAEAATYTVALPSASWYLQAQSSGNLDYVSFGSLVNPFDNFGTGTYAAGFTLPYGSVIFNGVALATGTAATLSVDTNGGGYDSNGMPRSPYNWHLSLGMYLPGGGLATGWNDANSDTLTIDADNLVYGTYQNASTMTVSLHLSYTGVMVEHMNASVVPLSVSISGPSMVETGQSGTWTATVAGGTAPYTYEWYLLPAGSSLLGDDPGLIATGTAATFSHTMTVAGAFQVSLTVLDSTGAAAAATATVNVGATLGTGYRIEFARSGTQGLYLAVTVYDGTTGIISPIASTSGTQAGWYDDWGTTTNSFHWVASPSEAVWWQAFSWRWTLRFAYPDGSLGPPPEDFWFQTTITLTNGTHLSVMHHFATYGENSDTWTDDTGAVAVPETPPGAESSLPAWVQALLDGFKAVIRWAFVPSATDFSSQVEQGWVVITSPVPTIVPQYTIPFPNPDHMLAPTGDSVNMDFSMISTWTYYATVKALVQVCLDAILVFIVIGIVT